MKTKRFIKFALIIAILTLYFTACFVDWNPPDEIRINSLSEAKEKLAKYDFHETTPDDPVRVYVGFDLGDLSQPDNNYLRLIEIIGDSGLYVDLLLPSKMGGTTVFTIPPLSEAAKGMDKVVKIDVPSSATKIIPDINGKSPFFFYENLIHIRIIGTNVTHIDDYAFNSCKSIKMLSLYSVKSIGRDAFMGCENLQGVSFSNSLETIGDSAFYNCSSLKYFSLNGKLPVLGDSVFLGTTPGNFTFNINREYEGGFRKWITDNASNFNNNGEDIKFTR